MAANGNATQTLGQQSWQAPPLFLRSDVPATERHAQDGLTETLASAPDTRIFWEFYEAHDLCFGNQAIFDSGIPLSPAQIADIESWSDIKVTPESIESYYNDPDWYFDICGFSAKDPFIREKLEEYFQETFADTEFPARTRSGDALLLNFSCETDYDLRDPETDRPPDTCHRPDGAGS